MPAPPSGYPVAHVEFDGQPVPPDAVRLVELESNVGFLADAITVVLDNAALYSDFLRKEMELNAWLGYVGDPHHWDRGELVHVFSGGIDGVLPTFADDRVLTIKARDHARLLIDSQADPGWAYATLDDAGIVKLLCERAGLRADVAPAASKFSEEDEQAFLGGGYVGDPQVGMSGWDIVQTLAVRNGYVAYVTPDKTLHWGPRGWVKLPGVFGVRAPTTAASVGTWTYLAEPFDVLAADFDDSALVVNKVTVSRWVGIDEEAAGFVSGSHVDAGRLKAARGRVVEKTLVSRTAKGVPECEAEAANILAGITASAITAAVSLEGSPRLLGDVKLTLAGKALGRFAGDYWLESCTHRFGADGYGCEARLSSVRPEASEVYRPSLAVLDPEEAGTLRPEGPTAAQGPLGAFYPVVTQADERFGAIAWTNTGTHAVAGHPKAGAADIFALIGAPIYAPVDGTIVYASSGDVKGGNNAVLQGADGQWYYFAHGNQAFVSGAVKGGQPIGKVGQTGQGGGPAHQAEGSRGTGGWAPHLHFAIDTSNRFDVLAGKGEVRFGHEYWTSGGGAPTTAAGTQGAMGRAPTGVQAVIRGGGWPAAQWDNAAAIVERETAGTWNPRSLNTSGEYSVGLFQVNIGPGAWKADVEKFLGLPANSSIERVRDALFDPLTNSQVAYHVPYLHGGWHWWSTAGPLGLA